MTHAPGLIRFQPWIARDVQARLQAWEKETTGLFLSSSSQQHFYTGVHIESKYWVDEYWKQRQQCRMATENYNHHSKFHSFLSIRGSY
jgi:hypothetical protein